MDNKNEREDNNVLMTECGTSEIEYLHRVYQYQQTRKYDSRIDDIYHHYQIMIDDVVYQLEKSFMIYKNNSLNNQIHLQNVKSRYTDILTNSVEKYEFDEIIRLRDTTAFIELINSECVTIDQEKKIIVINNKDKAAQIISEWNGMLHDRVAETDAILNKQLMNKLK